MKKHIEWLKCRIAISKEFENYLLELEKMQIIDAYIKGYKNMNAENYYNETYKVNKEKKCCSGRTDGYRCAECGNAV